MNLTPRPITNPFAPPEAVIDSHATAEPSDFFALFLRWEKYRFIYNGILLLETMFGLASTTSFRDLLTRIDSLIIYAICANVCFCAGVIVNGYAWWFGLRSPWMSRTIFAAGTLLAMLLVVAALIYLVRPSAFLAD